MYDAIIVGGGPAGLAAALTFGRVRRQVLVTDSGTPRNAPATATHNLFALDGTPPDQLRRTAREQALAYPSVEIRDVAVTRAERADEGFQLTLADGAQETARRLLLATGVADDLPSIPGVAELWGRGVYHCPYCHGWEVRDQPLAVLGAQPEAIQLALYLTRLSPDVVLCTNTQPAPGGPFGALLAAWDVTVRTEPVLGVEGTPGKVEQVVFEGAEPLARSAVFVHPDTRQQSDLAAQLGCTLLEDGFVQVDELAHTTVPGVAAAGDQCRTPVMPFPAAQVGMAAAAGARAAVVIDQELTLEAAGLPGDLAAMAHGTSAQQGA